MMYAADVETLGVTSDAVLLSVALVPFQLEMDMKDPVATYNKLLQKAYFMKVEVADQVQKYHRKIDAKTMEWWKKQNKIAFEKSFKPNVRLDVKLEDVMKNLEYYLYSTACQGEDRKNPPMFWMRGTLDQIVLDDCCNTVGIDRLVPYNRWRDFRTAIDLIAEQHLEGNTAEALVPGFDPKQYVYKHCPDHDCAYDILQLLSCS